MKERKKEKKGEIKKEIDKEREKERERKRYIMSQKKARNCFPFISFEHSYYANF